MSRENPYNHDCEIQGKVREYILDRSEIKELITAMKGVLVGNFCIDGRESEPLKKQIDKFKKLIGDKDE